MLLLKLCACDAHLPLGLLLILDIYGSVETVVSGDLLL